MCDPIFLRTAFLPTPSCCLINLQKTIPPQGSSFKMPARDIPGNIQDCDTSIAKIHEYQSRIHQKILIRYGGWYIFRPDISKCTSLLPTIPTAYHTEACDCNRNCKLHSKDLHQLNYWTDSTSLNRTKYF